MKHFVVKALNSDYTVSPMPKDLKINISDESRNYFMAVGDMCVIMYLSCADAHV